MMLSPLFGRGRTPPWRGTGSGMFDLRKLAVGVALVLVGVTGVLMLAVSSSSAKSIIADANQAAHASLNTCYEARDVAVHNLTVALMDSVVGDVEAQVSSYLAAAVTEVQAVAQYLSLFHPSVSDNWDWVDTTLRPLLAAAMEVRSSRGIVELGVWGGGGQGGGLPPGKTKHLLLFTSPEAIVNHEDASFFKHMQSRMGMDDDNETQFMVLQFEGAAPPTDKCGERAQGQIKAALGITDEKGSIDPDMCFFGGGGGHGGGGRGGHDGAPPGNGGPGGGRGGAGGGGMHRPWSRPEDESGECSDNLDRQPFCTFGGLPDGQCTCAGMVKEHPCGTKFPISFGGWHGHGGGGTPEKDSDDQKTDKPSGHRGRNFTFEREVSKHCPRTCGECRETKSDTCFHSPDGKWQAKWEVGANNIARFDVSAEVPEGGWAAIGFSCDKNMAGSDVVAATVAGGVSDRFATGYKEPEVDPTGDVTDASVERDGARLRFRFSRPLLTGDKRDLDLTQPAHILWAYGSMDKDDPTALGYHDARSYSVQKILLSNASACGRVPSGPGDAHFGRPHASGSTDAAKGDPLAGCRFIPGSMILDRGEKLVARALTYPAEEVRWTPIEGNGPFLCMQAFSAWQDPDDAGRRVGVVRASVDVRALSLRMRRIGEEELGADGYRLYAVQTNPWTAASAGFAGASHGSVISHSGHGGHRHYEAQPVLPGAPEPGDTDPIIAAHAKEVSAAPGGFAALSKTKGLTAWRNPSDNAEYFVRARRIDSADGADSGMGLDVVLLLPRRSVVGAIDDATDRAKVAIAQNGEVEEDKRESALLKTVLILVACLAALMGGAAWTSYQLTPALQVDGGGGVAAAQLGHARASNQPPVELSDACDGTEEVALDADG